MLNRDISRMRDRIDSKLQKIVRGKKDLRNALLLIHSDKHKMHWKFAAGTTGQEAGAINPDHPYHIASIGKTFISLLLARLRKRQGPV